jgi:hypothetical protein
MILGMLSAPIVALVIVVNWWNIRHPMTPEERAELDAWMQQW